jgi:hypothetical protein
MGSARERRPFRRGRRGLRGTPSGYVPVLFGKGDDMLAAGIGGIGIVGIVIIVIIVVVLFARR